ncbi:hypothetical protein FocTR4_00011364 [Fusarium oxysporum f. sp. cubense]|uniref:Heterokaryon incompatibility domain-containing protein n=1 Tax=Fusarium oxysporum f. sp. cubense TaxID=61366 RepID=A0A5C6SFG5_FUSOC|nr:hypothetical protein FocTR4_00011364 [Fusarium oxysporum f. sp. cubense]
MIGGMAIYRHLRRDNSQTRLVRVLQASPHDIHLSLELRHGFIEDSTYSALSYAWGDASEEEYILVNRVLFRIRKNLYQALLQLRDNGIRDWLWIDTIGNAEWRSVIRREKEKVRRISSIGEFANLPHDSGPGEDYVWRTLESCYAPVSQDTDQEVRSIIRALMRQQAISLEELTTSQIDYLDLLTLPVLASLTWNVTEKPSNAIKQIKEHVLVSERGRNLLKTQKGMLGLGHEFVQPGDTVTLLLGVHSSIVLRSRCEGGFTFVGDAYMDGIMQGEFLQTNPVEQEFVIY